MPCSVPVNCPVIICLPFMPCCLSKESTSSELWTPVQYLPLIHMPMLLVYLLQTITFHTIRLILCYSKPVSLTTSLIRWGKVLSLCCAGLHVANKTPLRRFLPPSGSITSVSSGGNMLLCSSHLALGVPTKCPTSTLGARIKISGAVAGEAKDVFTRGVLHFISLYFVSFAWFCLPLFNPPRQN